MTGTLIMMMTPARPAAVNKMWVSHLFITRGSNLFDANRSVNFSEFTVKPNEEHILLTDLHAPPPSGNSTPVKYDASLPRLRLCYKIHLKRQDLILKVGKEVPLSLLLKTSCLAITSLPLMVERRDEMLAQLFPPNFTRKRRAPLPPVSTPKKML